MKLWLEKKRVKGEISVQMRERRTFPLHHSTILSHPRVSGGAGKREPQKT